MEVRHTVNYIRFRDNEYIKGLFDLIDRTSGDVDKTIKSAIEIAMNYAMELNFSGMYHKDAIVDILYENPYTYYLSDDDTFVELVTWLTDYYIHYFSSIGFETAQHIIVEYVLRDVGVVVSLLDELRDLSYC